MFWTVNELGMSMTEIGNKLGISVSTVSVAVEKGRKIVEKEGLNLLDLLNEEMQRSSRCTGLVHCVLASANTTGHRE